MAGKQIRNASAHRQPVSSEKASGKASANASRIGQAANSSFSTDETRRSGRANKGHHSHKDKEITELPAAKTKKGGKKANKASKNEPSDDEPEDIIRCICGATTDEQDGSKMICCESCDAWQHNICMAISIKKKEEPAEYFCEQCKPDQHQELMRLLNEEKKSLFEIAADRIIAAPKGASKPKLPDGFEHYGTKSKAVRKSGRASMGNLAASEEAVPQPQPPTPPAEQPKTGTKRQLPVDEPATNGKHTVSSFKCPIRINQVYSLSVQSDATDQAAATPTASAPKRLRGSASSKASEPKPEPKAEPKPEPKPEVKPEPITEPSIESPEKLPPERRAPTSALSGTIAEKIKEFTKDQSYSDDGAYQVPDGETAATVAARYAADIERAMFEHYGVVKGAYGDQFRTIRANLKKNADLTKRLLRSTLLPSELALMTAEDMADEETKKKDAIARELAEKQAFALREEGPRLITDHKGPRYVGGEEESSTVFQTVSSTTAEQNAARRESILSGERPPTAHSNDAGSPMQVELPEDVGMTDRPALSVDTSQHPTASNRRSSSNAQEFDIRSILQRTPVISENTGLRPLQHPPRRRSSAMHRQSGGHEQSQNVDDPDVDRLLMDDGAEGSSTNYSAGAVWSGHVSMTGVEDFRVHAMQVAGADYKEQLWHQGVLKSALNITGRIPIKTADNYVLGMRHSTSKDVVVLSLVPDSDDDNTSLRQVYQYCRGKERWGVVHSTGLREDVCDAYIVPVESGTGNLPTFLEAMEDVRIEQPRKDQLLLLVLIVKHDRTPSSSHTLATPIRPAETPVVPTYAAANALPDGLADGALTSSVLSQQSPYSQGPMSIEDAPPLAREILGDMLSYPIFSHPMMKVSLPQMSHQMLENLRDLLQEHPECRSDLMRMSTTLNQLSPTDAPTAA